MKGHSTPMEVMDTPFRAGDLRHGYQAVADNLPNDARIHQEKGTKKIFFKNFMDARVYYVVIPIGKQVMVQAAATMKRLVMELGGHAPLIIFDDADLDRAVDIAVNAKFATSGQDCLAANRISHANRKVAAR